jgi:hypothetical protein
MEKKMAILADIFRVWLAVAMLTVGLHYLYEGAYSVREVVSKFYVRDDLDNTKH